MSIYGRTNVIAANIEGTTAVQHLISSPNDVPQGSFSPYIMYAGSAIVPSREAHPRSTATGKRIVGVAVVSDSVFHPQKDGKKSTSPTQFQVNVHVTLPLKGRDMHFILILLFGLSSVRSYISINHY